MLSVSLFCTLVLPSRYTEKANTIEQEDSLVNIQAVQLDCSPLKSLLVQHCSEWQTKFTELLKDKATNRLKELYSLMQSSDRWENLVVKKKRVSYVSLKKVLHQA